MRIPTTAPLDFRVTKLWLARSPTLVPVSARSGEALDAAVRDVQAYLRFKREREDLDLMGQRLERRSA